MSLLRIMTFNVRNSSSREVDGENAWEFRRELNVRTIEKYDPDLLGMQETQQDQWDYYQEHLAGYECWRGSCEYGNHQCLPIFWKPSSFQLIDKGSFWLSPTPEEYSLGWEANCVRAASWVKLSPRSENMQKVLLLNTHLDHESSLARLKSASLIVEMIQHIRDSGQHVLVTGDFNCDPGSPPHSYFLDSGYADNYPVEKKIENEADYTFHAFRGIRHPEFGRIDWILSLWNQDGLHLRDAQIIRDTEKPVYPSDHYPVIADFDI